LTERRNSNKNLVDIIYIEADVESSA